MRLEMDLPFICVILYNAAKGIFSDITMIDVPKLIGLLTVCVPLISTAAIGGLSGYGFADFRSAYYSRGAIVNKEPILPLFGRLTYSLDPVGYVGGDVWTVNALSHSGQTADRRNAFHEVDLKPFYGYRWKFSDECSLDSMVARQWILLPGYRTDPPTINEWQFGQELHNPYITPYYLLRHAFKNHRWTYWCVGVRRSFPLGHGLSLRPNFWCDFGDSDHFQSQYGRACSDGLMALNGELRLDWWFCSYMSAYTSLQQFGIVSRSGRDALQSSSAAQSVTDLTIFTIGVAARF